jgi:ribosome-associated toxin RatA of RatAB toxin-antitoxin module
MTDQATERTRVEASPERCYEVASDFERYPEWAAGIKQVTVDDRDDEGRPRRVTYRAGGLGRSTSYTLEYEYRGAPERLGWVQVAGDLTRRLDGEYLFEPDDGGTEVTYHLLAELKVPLPGFVKQRATGLVLGAALKDLKRRVET